MSEQRLIDANALMQALGITDMDCVKCAWYSRAIRRCKRGGDFEDACCAIENAPTIEERKGKWIQDPKSKRYRCDQCLSAALKTDDGQENLSDFCPVCGADMREQP